MHACQDKAIKQAEKTKKTSDSNLHFLFSLSPEAWSLKPEAILSLLVKRLWKGNETETLFPKITSPQLNGPALFLSRSTFNTLQPENSLHGEERERERFLLFPYKPLNFLVSYFSRKVAAERRRREREVLLSLLRFRVRKRGSESQLLFLLLLAFDWGFGAEIEADFVVFCVDCEILTKIISFSF